MAVRELSNRPEAYAHFPDDGTYRWLELADGHVYSHVAFTERDDYVEMHISLDQWGPGVLRHLKQDIEWLKDEARRLGKKRIMGVRADDTGRYDSRLFRFAKLFGFTDMHVYQTASLDL